MVAFDVGFAFAFGFWHWLLVLAMPPATTPSGYAIHPSSEGNKSGDCGGVSRIACGSGLQPDSF